MCRNSGLGLFVGGLAGALILTGFVQANSLSLQVPIQEKVPAEGKRIDTQAASKGEAPQSSASPNAEAFEKIRKLIKEGRYRDAEAAARVLVAQVEAASGPNSLEAAEALDLLVEALWQGGKSTEPQARELAERAVAIKEKALGATHPSLATSLFHLAAFRSDAGDYAGAKPLFERALAIREQALGSNHPDVAFTLNVFGSSLTRAGDYAGARRLIERGLAIREKTLGVEHLDVAGSLNNLAVVLFHTGDFTGAMSLLERAVTIWEKNLGPDHPRVGLGLANLAALHARMRDYAGARPLFERSLAIQEKTLGPDHPQVALSLSNLANLLSETGDYVAARPLYERSLAIREKVLGPDHHEVAAGLVNLANLLREMGEYADARPLYQRAVAIAEKGLGPEHPQLAESLFPLAVLLAEIGEMDEAVQVALRADNIGREHLRLTSRTLAEREALNYASARPSGLDLALTVMAEDLEKVPGSKQAVWDALVRSRALVLDEMAARHHTVAAAEDPEIGRLARDLASAREQLAKLLVRGPGNEPPQHYRDLLDQGRQEKEKAERTLAEKSVAFRTERARTKVGLDEVAAALPPDSALLAFARYGRHQLGQRQPSGKPPEPIPSYLAFVLYGGKKEPTLVPIGTAEEIDALVSHWREQIAREAGTPGPASKRTEAAYRSAAAELREKVWDPLAPYVRGAQHVFVVPDGTLHLVNFDALPTGRSSYLIESGPLIHYLSAERDLVPTETPARGHGLLVVGAPAFDETSLFAALAPEGKKTEPSQPVQLAALRTFRGQRSACGEFDSMRFEPLPASAREAEDIIALWEKGSRKPTETLPMRSAVQRGPDDALYLKGSGASETAFKQQAAGKRVLHLATHGFFLGGRCASALEPLPKPKETGTPLTGENPLLLAGLALAGANHRQAAGPDEEDGILTAEEIGALDLTGVEWAVLSACDTGVGEIRASEGVFGLRRAFQVAGARTVIMSLWPVEDQTTRQWMTTLYQRRLLKRLSTAESVRDASLEVLRQRRAKKQTTHPFYWAGFVAAGDWR